MQVIGRTEETKAAHPGDGERSSESLRAGTFFRVLLAGELGASSFCPEIDGRDRHVAKPAQFTLSICVQYYC